MVKIAPMDGADSWMPPAPSRRSVQTGVMQARVGRTRRALLDALLDVLVESEWEAVRVDHLCEKARVRRTTFYNHFAGKEELLLSGLDDLPRKLREAARTDGRARFGFIRPLLRFVQDRSWIARALADRGSEPIVRRRLAVVVVRMLEDHVPDRPGERGGDAALRYVAAAMVEAIHCWITTESRASIDDVAAMLERMTGAALDAQT